MALNEDDLLRLLHSTEHSFAERKTIGDHKDWAKTIVAFANSLDSSQDGVLFIGAKDDGEIETNATNLDKLQKTLSERMSRIYPPIYHTTKTVKDGDRECLAVIVPGSTAKPHFAGQPYLRRLSETVIATPDQYDSLLATRTSKARELQQWIDRDITIVEFKRSPGIAYQVLENVKVGKVITCNQFYLSVLLNGQKWSYALSSFEISYDHTHDRLRIERIVPQSGPF
jgi:hypothetical protein